MFFKPNTIESSTVRNILFNITTSQAYVKIQKKIHPDISPETSRLSSIVNEAKDIVLSDIS